MGEQPVVGSRKQPDGNPHARLWCLDLNADISNGRWTVRVYAKNVWDERAYPSVFIFNNFLTGAVIDAIGTPIQPRTVGLEVDCKF